jgi:hypothetical protein
VVIYPLPYKPSWNTAKVVKHRDKFASFIFTLKNILAYLLVGFIEEKSIFHLFVVNFTTFSATEIF